MNDIYILPGRKSKNPVSVSKEINIQWNPENGKKCELILSKDRDTISITINTDVVELLINEQQIKVQGLKSNPKSKSLSGTYRALIQNAADGLITPWQVDLIFEGVGYKVMPGNGANSLALHVGYSFPRNFTLPENINYEIVDNNRRLILKGINKQELMQIAAKIRKNRPPNAYSGKGIRYGDEVVHKKEVGK